MFTGFKSPFLADTGIRLVTSNGQKLETCDPDSAGTSLIDIIPAHGIVLAQHSSWFLTKLQRWASLEGCTTTAPADSTNPRAGTAGTAGTVPRTITIEVFLGEDDTRAAFEAMLEQFYLTPFPGHPTESDSAQVSISTTVPDSSTTSQQPDHSMAAQHAQHSTTTLLDNLTTPDVIRVLRMSDYYDAAYPAGQAARTLASRARQRSISWEDANSIFALGCHEWGSVKQHLQVLEKEILDGAKRDYADLDKAWQASSLRELWHVLPANIVHGILSDPTIKAACEDTVLLMLASWVHAQPHTPDSPWLDKLCSSIRWPQISSVYAAAVAPQLPWLWTRMQGHLQALLFATKHRKISINEGTDTPAAQILRDMAVATGRPPSSVATVQLEVEVEQDAIKATFAQLQTISCTQDQQYLGKSDPRFYAGFHWQLHVRAHVNGCVYCDLGVEIGDGSDEGNGFGVAALPVKPMQLPVVPILKAHVGIDHPVISKHSVHNITGKCIPLGSVYSVRVTDQAQHAQYVHEGKLRFIARVAGEAL